MPETNATGSCYCNGNGRAARLEGMWVRPGVIFHCDMDAFFAACHIAEDPSLQGRPVAVAGDPQKRRGIILTASHAARAFGVRTAMPVGQALRQCPALLLIAPDQDLYRRNSRLLRGIFTAFTPKVEPFSIDEAWLDMTGALHPWSGDAVAAAHALKARVRGETRLTVSVGISPNKFLAKQASDLDKPDGLTVLYGEDVERRLWPKPAAALFGCGPSTCRKLASLGITTIGEIAHADPATLQRLLGRFGPRLWLRAQGKDEEPVELPRPEDVQSIGSETTLPNDVRGLKEAEPVLLALADEVASRLRAAGMEARTAHLKLRSRAFRTWSHQATLAVPANTTGELFQVACQLFRQSAGEESLRLIGLTASGLQPQQGQVDLFTGGRQRDLAQVVDRIRQRFGKEAIRPAQLILGTKLTVAEGSSFEKPWRLGEDSEDPDA